MSKTYFHPLRLDVNKPGRLQSFLHDIVVGERSGSSNFPGSFREQLAVRVQGRPRLDTPVVRSHNGRVVVMLNPAAWLADLVGLPVQGIPILNSTHQEPNVHQVKRVGLVGPLLGGIVDFEAHIGRHPAGLHGRDIGANHLAIGILISKIDSPEARARADIENALDIVFNGRHMQFEIVKQLDAMIVNFQAIEMPLVIRRPILCTRRGVAVVGSAVDRPVGENARGDGSG